MRGFILGALSLLAMGVSASPVEARADACMDKAAASRVAQNFRALIHEEFNVTLAKEAMTKDFHDYSDSVNELINGGCPKGMAVLGQPTFDSRKAFIAGQSSQPPIGFKILNLWWNCDTVFLRWTVGAPGTITTQQQKVTGIIAIETVASSGVEPWKMETVYSEFNSGAWLYDLGYFKPTNCTA